MKERLTDSDGARSIVSESFSLDEESPTPLWIQIRNRLLHLIMSGKLAPGDQFPSIRTLSVELKVNLNTISKVYASLQTDGFVINKRGKGLFVPDNLQMANMDALAEADSILAKEFISRCYASGMSGDDVIELVKRTVAEMRETHDKEQ